MRLKGDLIYAPADVMIMKFNENIKRLDTTKTYIGPAPIKVHHLAKPMRLLVVETESTEEKYLKVLFNGAKWHINKSDIAGE